MPDTLYSFRRCPYAMRARFALAISGQVVELREVVLRDKPDAMLAISPKATVPVLALATGAIIDQSLDIMRWALGRHDPERWMESDDATLIADCDDRFKHHLDRYKYPERFDTDALAHRSAACTWLAMLEDRLAQNGNLCRPIRSITDAAIKPFVRQFARVDPPWFDRQPLPRVRAWLLEHGESPLFAAVMERHKPWKPGDTPIFWPAER
ncbi:glutathione S-transferase [Sphingomonas sp. CARO-RG-8B-R24-01]|uniref:glutathione S-transferase n=1 Tax=Sphingomonas sp. CARO-RG-8B-R24-01 TaxID=2914831 RepID=UPI001F5735FF|nr:glutathione S-transferase [Sphingomonas sp. CARO-RG-8B-R24-01]